MDSSFQMPMSHALALQITWMDSDVLKLFYNTLYVALMKNSHTEFHFDAQGNVTTPSFIRENFIV